MSRLYGEFCSLAKNAANHPKPGVISSVYILQGHRYTQQKELDTYVYEVYPDLTNSPRETVCISVAPDTQWTAGFPGEIGWPTGVKAVVRTFDPDGPSQFRPATSQDIERAINHLRTY